MAAFGFSVLMREWRRGMAFDPWHGSLYLSLSTVITLSVMDRETNLHHWIWSAQSDTLNPFQAQTHAAPLISQRKISQPHLHDSLRVSINLLIDHLARKEKKRQKQICENIILFAELCNEKISKSSCSNFISYVCPNHTRASWLFKEVLLRLQPDIQPKTISSSTSFHSPLCGQWYFWTVTFRLRMLIDSSERKKRTGGQGSWPSWTWPGRRFSSQH